MTKEIKMVIAGIYKHLLQLLGARKMSGFLKQIQKQGIKVICSILERAFVGLMSIVHI